MRHPALIIAATQQVHLAAVEEGESLGPELVTNGDFSSSTGWTRQGDDGFPPTISGGKLNFNAAESLANCQRAVSGGTLTNGHTYRIEGLVDSNSAGTLYLYLGGALIISGVPAGAFSEDVTFTEIGTPGNQLVRLVGENTNAVVDFVSVKEVL